MTCATELAKLLVDAYGEDRLPADEAAVLRILRILDCYESSTSSSPVDYNVVGKAAIKWIHAANGSGDLVARIHERIGQYMWAREGLQGLWQAIAHYARSRDTKRFSQMLLQASKVIFLPLLLNLHVLCFQPMIEAMPCCSIPMSHQGNSVKIQSLPRARCMP